MSALLPSPPDSASPSAAVGTIDQLNAQNSSNRESVDAPLVEDNEESTVEPSTAHTADEGDDSVVPPEAKQAKVSEIDPSLVVHVRELCGKATDADVMEALQHFGTISYVTCMQSKGMALVEFEDLTGAEQCIDYANAADIFIAGQTAQFNYSTSQFIQRLGLECAQPNHVIIITVTNVQFPINVDVIHQVCKPTGDVRRIVMLRRHGTQALVEYDSPLTAKGAKVALNGADIYSGCCTLKVEYAKVDSVKVTRHDKDQWDFTIQPESLISQEVKEEYLRKVLTTPQDPNAATPYQYLLLPPPTLTSLPTQLGQPTVARDRSGAPPPPVAQFGSSASISSSVVPPPITSQASVVMLYGIDQAKISCDKVFNLFCCFGNVLRVKFMKTKRDTVMIEMNQSNEVEDCIRCLHGIRLFATELALRHSIQGSLHAKGDPYDLPDGSPSYKDFTSEWQGRHQRFDTMESARRNRIIRPTKVLHWYNAPPDINEDKLKEMYAKQNAPQPVNVVMFAGRSERSSSGVAEFMSPEEATDALVLANHTPVDSPMSRNPYLVKMSFAVDRNPGVIPQPGGGHPNATSGNSSANVTVEEEVGSDVKIEERQSIDNELN